MLSKNLPTARHRQALTARQKRIFNFLNERRVGVLSSVTPDGNPHGAVVYYTIKRDFTIHILTKTGTRKYDNLAHNDHVMLTVYDSGSQTTAQCTGRAFEKAGTKDVAETANAIFAHLAAGKGGREGLPPIIKLQAGIFTTFEIEPLQIRMALYAHSSAGDYGNIFESIESFELESS